MKEQKLMTIKELAAERELLLVEDEKLAMQHVKDPKYIKAVERVEAIKIKHRLETQARRKEIGERRWKIDDEIIALRIKKAKEPVVPTPATEAWLQKIRSGIQDSNKWTVVWASQNQRFLILKFPGGMHWAGRGSRSYAQTQHRLYDTKTPERVWYSDCVAEHEGRFHKDVFEHFKSVASKLEKNSQ